MMFASCIPKDQYDTVVTERDFYRNKTIEADSIADVKALQTYDRVDNTSAEQRDRIRELESLKATNLAINSSYQTLQTRYDDLLRQNQQLLTNSGQEVTELQRSLAERTQELSKKEADLRRMEIDLGAREAALARVDSNAPEVTAQPPGAVTPRGASDRPAISGSRNAALRLNEIQSDLNQLLAYLPAGTYLVGQTADNRLRVTLSEASLTSDGYVISEAGTTLLRKMANTLRNYPRAKFNVIGHAGGDEEDPQSAYEQSTDKAISIGQALIDFGISPTAVMVSGKGYYAPVAESATEAGREANRRLEIVVSIAE